jgi:hypothetical protein
MGAHGNLDLSVQHSQATNAVSPVNTGLRVLPIHKVQNWTCGGNDGSAEVSSFFGFTLGARLGDIAEIRGRVPHCR